MDLYGTHSVTNCGYICAVFSISRRVHCLCSPPDGVILSSRRERHLLYDIIVYPEYALIPQGQYQFIYVAIHSRESSWYGVD